MNFDTRKKNLKNHKTWTIRIVVVFIYDTCMKAKPFHDDYDEKKRESKRAKKELYSNNK